MGFCVGSLFCGAVRDVISSETLADPEGGGQGSPLENHKATGFHINSGMDPLLHSRRRGTRRMLSFTCNMAVCSVSLSRVTVRWSVGWSVVCDCGISWSYPLTCLHFNRSLAANLGSL